MQPHFNAARDIIGGIVGRAVLYIRCTSGRHRVVANPQPTAGVLSRGYDLADLQMRAATQLAAEVAAVASKETACRVQDAADSS